MLLLQLLEGLLACVLGWLGGGMPLIAMHRICMERMTEMLILTNWQVGFRGHKKDTHMPAG